jgi:hypothetical protein
MRYSTIHHDAPFALWLAAVGVDLAELFDGVQELAGDAGGVEAELGDLADADLRGERVSAICSPAAVRGPVECFELARLVAARL